MESARTIAGLAVALIAVALLVRVPVSDVDLGREVPTAEQASPTPTDGATPAPGLVEVHPLDPVTLQRRTDGPVAVLQGPVVHLPAGDATMLVELDQAPGATQERVRIAAPPTVPTRWSQLTVDPHPQRPWIGASRTTVAWAHTDGRLRVQRPAESATPLALPLPSGRAVLDGVFMDDSLLALLLLPPASTASMSLIVLDTRSAEVVMDRALTGFGDPRGGGPPRWAHAWDPGARRLHLWDVASGFLATVDLRSGVRRHRAMEAPDGGGAAGLVAGGGHVAAWSLPGDGEGDGTAASGLTLLDADLVPLAVRSDLALLDVLLGADGRVLALLEDGGVEVLDADLQQVGHLEPPATAARLVGVDDAVGYIAADGGVGSGQWLAAVELPTATVLAVDRISAQATFSPAGALLLTPADG